MVNILFLRNRKSNELFTIQKFLFTELTISDIRQDYVDLGSIFPYNHDIDGKTILVFIGKTYVHGKFDVSELKKCVLYWCERLQRENDYGKITVFFDMQACGLSNMDMDFSKFIVDTFKNYYPNAINYILIYEMPWILNAGFKIIKQLLPRKTVARMKFIYQKDIREYVPEAKMLKIWGGPVDLTYKFEDENQKRVS